MVRFRLLSLTVLAFGLAGFGWAQTPPTADELADQFHARVPAGWELEELIVEVQENYGTEVEPDIRTRFRVNVSLQQDTFEFAGELANAVLLRPVLAAGEQRAYFGIASSVRRLGEWETTFTLENNPTLGSGDVLDAFSGLRLIVGSSEEAEYRAALIAEEEAAAATEVARLQQAQRVREQERINELAEIAHVNALAEAEATAQREAEVARVAQERALATALREQQAAEYAEREAELQTLQTELAERLAMELRVLLAGHWTIEDVETTGTTWQGTFDRPEFNSAFTATLELKEDTYTSQEVEGGGQVLNRLQAAGTIQSLEGIAEATWFAGIWELNLEFRNLDAFSAGLPRDYYPATAVIAGSAEETAYWQAFEEAAQSRLERELAEIAREEQLESARHEAARTAAAQAAQLEAISLAARAAALAAFEQAVTSTDQAERWGALEDALNSEDEVRIGHAIPLALSSGNGRLVNMAMARVWLEGGGGHFSQSEPAAHIVVTNLERSDDGEITAYVTGRASGSGNASNPSNLNCGSMVGTLQNGQLGLANSVCNLVIEPDGLGSLVAHVVSGFDYVYRMSAPVPGFRAE